MPHAHDNDLITQLTKAAELHVPFDGWSEATFVAAIADTGADPTLARAVCPRGALDLAVASHRAGDQAMIAAWAKEDRQSLKVREKITLAVTLRLQSVPDKEVVRRGTTLFSLPHLAPEGARLIWGTADAIWEMIGDPSRDFNWYTKRATLAGVYGATVLFWLGDTSDDDAATRAFLDRRIDDVMTFEKVKAQGRENPVLKPFLAVPNFFLNQIKAPKRVPDTDLPGGWPSR